MPPGRRNKTAPAGLVPTGGMAGLSTPVAAAAVAMPAGTGAGAAVITKETESRDRDDDAMRLARWRAMTKRAITQHQPDTALFWADKACSLSNGHRLDLYQLARAYMLTGQYDRASFLLESKGLLPLYAAARYLAAKCKIEKDEWEDALDILGDGPAADAPAEQEDDFLEIENVASAVSVLRGLVYEELDNRPQAVIAYKRALMLDVHCFEAFDRLTSHHMLTGAEELALLEALPFDVQCGADAAVIKHMYTSKIKKYEVLPEAMAAYTPPPSIAANRELAVSRAERHYVDCEFRQCYQITAHVLDEDPFHHSCLPIHLACQVELKDTNGLFFKAHQLVDSYPEKPVSWFAVGCYYYLIGNNENARRYFGKASRLDLNFGPAWLGFGHSFALEGEHDQAMTAYCTANRLLSGCHLPLLCIGIEYIATNNPTEAKQHFKQAYEICNRDPLVLHELGVIEFKTENYPKAEAYFREALVLCKPSDGDHQVMGTAWEPTLCNLALTCHKQRKYEDAIQLYEEALAICPRSAATYAGIAYTNHCMALLSNSSFATAIEWYHKALGLNPDDTFSAQMLQRALIAEVEQDVDGDDVGGTASTV